MTKNITSPIIALNNAAKKMAMGDMKIRLQTTHRRDRRVDQKLRSYGEIARSAQNKLRLTNQTLEQKVEERTKELAEINHNLDERVRTEVFAHRREQEQILIQQSRFAAMGEMIGNIAHQWRQPLNALSLFIQRYRKCLRHKEDSIRHL